MQHVERSFTPDDLEIAANDLAMLMYFTSEIRPSVIALLARICPHRRALRWLVDELVNHVGTWPGPKEVRGLLCTRFDAADGIDEYCGLPGYGPAEQEAKYLAQHEQRKIQERVGGYIAEESQELLKQLSGAMRQIPVKANTDSEAEPISEVAKAS